MFTALALTLAIGAPVPPPTAPVPAGTAPRVMELKPDANGKITVTVTRTEMHKVQVQRVVAGQGGVFETQEVPVMKNMIVELGDVKELTVTTADGKKLDKEEAMKKLAAGTIVVISGDGKAVSPVFLKVFKDETLVLASPELVAPQGGRPGMRSMPMAPAGGIQIQPGVIQLQIAPGAVLPALPLQPAQPAVPAQPVPAAPAKPAPAAPVPVAPAPVPVAK